MFRFNFWSRPLIPASAAQSVEAAAAFLPPPLTLPAGLTQDINKNDKDQSTQYSLPLFRPADLYSPIHQHLLRAQIELAAHSRDNVTNLNHSSAFAPTAKRQRTESGSARSSPGQQEDESCGESAASRSSTPRECDVTADGHLSPVPEGTLHCPVCRCMLPSQEMTSHLVKEIHELQRVRNTTKYDVMQSHDEKQQTCRSRYETFLRIRGNRETRLGESRLRGLRRKRPLDDLDHTHMRDEEEQIDVLGCDEPGTRLIETSQSPDSTDKPRDLSSSKINGSSPSTPDMTDSLCCHGCMTSFTKVTAVTSTKCWHVRCDGCWKTASSQVERCPQCSVSMTSDDLRRIYL